MSSGLWTVFAPTNAAFEALPEETLSAVLADKELLTDILLFHTVRRRRIYVRNLQCSTQLKMSNGKKSYTSCRNSQKFQTGPGNGKTADVMPKIVVKNVKACNGLIHGINQVMLPMESVDEPCG